MLSRTLEPEVMDTLEEAVEYDDMDHAKVNASFSEDFLAALGIVEGRSESEEERGPASGAPLRVLDVGTGTARIPLAICRKTDRLRITGIDLSAHMLQLGQRHVIAQGLNRVIKLEQVDAKQLPYGDATFDAVISNSIVHHIPEPIHVLREMVRVLRPGGLLFVRDLLRPADAETIEAILARHAADANRRQRQLFQQSLQAALTVKEIGQLLRELGQNPEHVRQSSDRHWTIVARK
ncbi:MAG: class I SAM-dependent methyltransferase [Planctomycetales bacterium]